MVIERLVDKAITGLSIVALSGLMGCSAVNRYVKINLTKTGQGCELTQNKENREVFRCADSEYVLTKTIEDSFVEGTTHKFYEMNKGGKTYRIRTEWTEGRDCPVVMEIDLENGSFRIEIDEECNGWGITRIRGVPDDIFTPSTLQSLLDEMKRDNYL